MCCLFTAGWWWWPTRTKPRSLGRPLLQKRPWNDGWETWCPQQRRRKACPQHGLGTLQCGRSMAPWSPSGPCSDGLSSWNQSRRGSRTCGCSQCGRCLRNQSFWVLCRLLQWRPPPRSSQPPSSRRHQRGAPYTEPGAGSQIGQGGHRRPGGLSWGQLSCCF